MSVLLGPATCNTGSETTCKGSEMRQLRIIFAALVVGYVVYAFTNDAERDEAGNIISEGQIDAFALQVGDCFNDSQAIIDSGSSEVEVHDVAGVPCSEPHDNEVYAVFDVSFDAFPGDESMFDLSTAECRKRFKGFVGKSYEESILDIFAVYPTHESWSQLDDREVVCAAYHLDYKKLTGSARGLGI